MPISSPTFRPVGATVTVDGAQNSKITNFTISTPNTESSHALQDNLKQLFIQNRSYIDTKISYTSGESGTKYITIYKGCSYHLKDISFSSKILYMQASEACIIEIQELY